MPFSLTDTAAPCSEDFTLLTAASPPPSTPTGKRRCSTGVLAQWPRDGQDVCLPCGWHLRLPAAEAVGRQAGRADWTAVAGRPVRCIQPSSSTTHSTTLKEARGRGPAWLSRGGRTLDQRGWGCRWHQPRAQFLGCVGRGGLPGVLPPSDPWSGQQEPGRAQHGGQPPVPVTHQQHPPSAGPVWKECLFGDTGLELLGSRGEWGRGRKSREQETLPACLLAWSLTWRQ